MPSFQAPVGTRDVLPPESARWERLVGLFRTRVELAGFGLVLSPMFEDAAVFERVGDATDVVRKEMYDFEDKGGRRLALRPEGTASVVRAFVQHRPPVPFKAWYAAPGFRYERPQAGRFRQHHQVGVEALGSEDPELDVEVVALAWSVAADLGLERVSLALNSLGEAACRPAYLAALEAFLRDRAGDLCTEHGPAAAAAAAAAVSSAGSPAVGSGPWNPLRVLDCKRAECRQATAGAPRSVDHLCADCATHFERVGQGLATLGVPFHVEPRLVRGLDYYTRTTFELAAESLDSAQNAIGGGGRYGGLAEALGGPPTPGIGFGMGIERLLLACDAEGVFPPPPASVDVWVVDATGGGHATVLAHRLRRAGIATNRAFDARSMKAQFRAADRSGARLALVVGEREAAAGTVLLRDLGDGQQQEVPSTEVVEHLNRRFAALPSAPR